MTETLRRRFGGGRWIPWTFVAFFLVVFAVNGVMVTVAFTTWTGVTIQNPYERGRAYNDVLAAVRAQEALGWRADLRFEGGNPTHGRLGLTLADRDGRPLPGAVVRARFVRPSHQGFDFELPLLEREAGRYGAAFELPLPGLWEVRVHAVRAGQSYRLTDRIVVGR
jgi:nitrogen fixation protein FixH